MNQHQNQHILLDEGGWINQIHTCKPGCIEDEPGEGLALLENGMA